MEIEAESNFVSFCTCHELDNNTLQCNCGEEYPVHDWTWDKDDLKNCTLLNNKRDVSFHGNFVVGTVRGELPFQPNRHYYWEIKILTGLSNAVLAVGVHTEEVRGGLNWEQPLWRYCNFGHVCHPPYCLQLGPQPRFGKGSIIGVHLDTCNGTLEFYNNRRPLGVAVAGLKGMQLYPVVRALTDRPGAVRLTCALSMTTNLQLLSMLTLHKNTKLASSIAQVPGLRNLLASRFWWLMGPEQTQHEDRHAIVSSPSPSHETGPSSSRKRKRQRGESSSSDSDDDDQ